MTQQPAQPGSFPNPDSGAYPAQIYQEMFALAADGILRVNPDGLVIAANQRIAELYGRALSHVIGFPAEALFEAESLKLTPLRYDLLRQGQTVVAERKIRRPDDFPLWVEIRSRMLPDGSFHAIFRDITSRKLAEEALRLSEEKFAQAFKTSPDSININRLSDGVYIDINDGFTRITGYTREDVIGHSSLPGDLGIWAHSEDRDRLVAGLKTHGEVNGLEAEFRCKDGRIILGSMSARLIRIGGELCLLNITRDITEHKRVENALRESESKYRQIFNSTHDALFIHDEAGRILDLNESACRNLGLSREAALTHTFMDLDPGIPPYTAEEALRRLKLALHGDPQTFLWHLSGPEDARRWVDVSIHACEINGRTRLIVSVRDITDHKLAADALAAERERLLVTLRSIGDGVIATDTEGRVAVINAVAERLTGWTQAEAEGRPLSEIFTIVNEITRLPCDNPAMRVLAENAPVELANHTLLISRDGSERIIGDCGSPIRDREGRIQGVVLVFRDMTEKQRLLDSAAKAQKLEALSVLAGGIAHDFNNLLGGIFGYIDLAQDASRDAQVSEYLQTALDTLERARGLTHQLLTFAKGGAPVQKVEALAPLIKETARFVLSGSNVSFKLELDPALPPVRIDKNQIGQVLDNVLINAQQAMPSGGVVSIRAAQIEFGEHGHPTLPAGLYVRVSISDEGAGIPKNILPRIFDPFFTTKPKGSGLGLATCYSILKRHDGGIEAESEPGHGSTFHILIPACREEICADPGARPGVRSGSGRILVMDDEAVIQDMAVAMLSRLGFTAVCTPNGREAVAEFFKADREGRPYTAVILDLTVPGGMGGQEAAQEIRRRFPEVPLYVASGYAEDPVVADPNRYGFTGSLRKPFTLDDLTRILGRV